MSGSDPAAADPVAARVALVGRSSTTTIAAGVLNIVLGLLILAWPDANLSVVAWIIAIQLLIAGVLQLLAAFSAVGGAASHVLHVLLGALSILVGLLCLREPQTATALGLLVGALWVVGGVIAIALAIATERGTVRRWRIASGAVFALGGTAILVYPEPSVTVLTSMLGTVLVVEGMLSAASGLTARLSGPPVRRAAVPHSEPAAALADLTRSP